MKQALVEAAARIAAPNMFPGASCNHIWPAATLKDRVQQVLQITAESALLVSAGSIAATRELQLAVL